ncbi:MAG TPA: SHOCT domain-containing protein [Polyangiales bacterium]|nr:SHOCT domain-containing protein [Polyangiales bacterium]
MQLLTDAAWNDLSNIAQRYGVSTDAARTLLDALWRGNGSMAQFNHPELGGYGQWMRGGMTMVGDMFNNGLKATVDNLCAELNRLLERGNPYVQQAQSQGGGGGNWWPSELGSPNSSGGQNNIRYAYFSGSRRLAIEEGGVVTVYDTLQHQIGGVSQQQSGGHSLTFSSQFGNVDLSQLPVVSGNQPQAQYQAPQQPHNPAPSYSSSSSSSDNEADIFAKIEKLANLRQKGVLSDDEFNAKKAELLSRI